MTVEQKVSQWKIFTPLENSIFARKLFGLFFVVAINSKPKDIKHVYLVKPRKIKLIR